MNADETPSRKCPGSDMAVTRGAQATCVCGRVFKLDSTLRLPEHDVGAPPDGSTYQISGMSEAQRGWCAWVTNKVNGVP